MRIPSASTDQYLYFKAKDSAGNTLTGLSGFTVSRSRNGAAAAAYTTPTITEVSSSLDPGTYALLLDEDTTIASTSDSEEYKVRISVAGMNPVDRTVEIYRRTVTVNKTLSIGTDSKALLSTDAQTGVTIPTVTTLTGHTAQTGDVYALANGTSGFVATKADTAAVKLQTDKMVFTVANQIDSNIQYVNDVQVTGTGAAGSEWGPV